ncbi:MAG TPA: hypothetical protein VGL81_37300 [Polyangiaceae bacterium]|jgi:catechol 2,3-dioxygenase-like lactoylglutathione lyase family enzyme
MAAAHGGECCRRAYLDAARRSDELRGRAPVVGDREHPWRTTGWLTIDGYDTPELSRGGSRLDAGRGPRPSARSSFRSKLPKTLADEDARTMSTLTPLLVVPDVVAAVAFYVEALVAREVARYTGREGIVTHVDLVLGGAPFAEADLDGVEGGDGLGDVLFERGVRVDRCGGRRRGGRRWSSVEHAEERGEREGLHLRLLADHAHLRAFQPTLLHLSTRLPSGQARLRGRRKRRHVEHLPLCGLRMRHLVDQLQHLVRRKTHLVEQVCLLVLRTRRLAEQVRLLDLRVTHLVFTMPLLVLEMRRLVFEATHREDKNAHREDKMRRRVDEMRRLVVETMHLDLAMRRLVLAKARLEVTMTRLVSRETRLADRTTHLVFEMRHRVSKMHHRVDEMRRLEDKVAHPVETMRHLEDKMAQSVDKDA